MPHLSAGELDGKFNGKSIMNFLRVAQRALFHDPPALFHRLGLWAGNLFHLEQIILASILLCLVLPGVVLSDLKLMLCEP